MRKLWLLLIISVSCSAQIATSGLIAKYRMKNCDGSTITTTTLPDCSGNGNDATLTTHGGSGHPTGTTKGLSFDPTSQTADMPSNALSSVVTIQIVGDWATCAEDCGAGFTYPYFGHLTTSNALHMDAKQGSGSTVQYPLCGIASGVGNTFSTAAPWRGGASMCTAVLSSTSDTIYFDDHVASGYRQSSHGAQLTATRTGVFQLGGSTAIGQYFNGMMYYALFYNRALTPAEIAANYAAVASELTARGVVIHPVNTSTTNQIIYLGDSLTANDYAQYVTPTDTYTSYVRGFPGNTCADLYDAKDFAIQHYAPGAAHNIVVLWCGTNDGTVTTPATAIESYKALATALKKTAGMQVIIGSMISRTGTAFGSVSFDAWKNTFNSLLFAKWSTYADGMADFHGTALGADGAYSSGSFADGIHPTDGTNSSTVAPVAQVAINAMAPPVWIMGGGPSGIRLGPYSADGSGHAIISTVFTHSFIPGTSVVHICCYITSDTANHRASNLNGIFRVKASSDNSHFTILNLDGTEVTPNASYAAGDGSTNNGFLLASSVIQQNLPVGPKAWFDGTNGPQMKKLATSKDNGLTTVSVSSGVATVTFNYVHDAQVGDSVAVYRTTASGNLNGTHTITAVPSTTSFQFATTTANGTYTDNDVCGPSVSDPNVIGGTEPCVVVSLWATTANPFWVQCLSQAAFTGTDYKHVWDGGTFTGWGNTWMQPYVCNAYRGIVDRGSQLAVDMGVYFLSKPERMYGVNYLHQTGPDGGMQGMEHYEYSNWTAGINYTTFSKHLNSTQDTHARDSILNDWNNPSGTQCDETLNIPHQLVLSSSTAQGGDGNHITLNASESVSPATGTSIAEYDSGNSRWYVGRVTAYNSGTKSATVAGISYVNCDTFVGCSDYDAATYQTADVAVSTWTSPGSGTPYKILATASVNSTGTTITGTSTNFSTSLSVGDAVYLGRYWPSGTYPASGLYVTNVGSNTTLTTIDGDIPSSSYSGTFAYNNNGADAGNPKPVFLIKAWSQSSHSCGLGWRYHFITDTPGGQKLQYPPNGGVFSAGVYNEAAPYEANYMALFAALTDSDARGRSQFTIQNHYIQALVASVFSQVVAPVDGPHYGSLNDLPGENANIFFLNNLTPAQYGPIATGPLMKSLLLFPIYWQSPDTPCNGSGFCYPFQMIYSANNSGDIAAIGAANGKTEKLNVSAGMAYNVGAESRYHRDYMIKQKFYPSGSDVFASQYFSHELFLFQDPRIAALDYTGLPLQRVFMPDPVTLAQCNTLTGGSGTWNHGCDYFRDDMFVSRTSWDDTSTYARLQALSCCLGYDGPASAEFTLYKRGWFLGSNSGVPPGSGYPNGTTGEMYKNDTSEHASVFQLNGTNTLNTNVGDVANDTNITHSSFTRWASGNHGSWDYSFGDQDGHYAYVMADVTNSYTPAPLVAYKEIVHFKTGTEAIFQHWYVHTASALTGGILGKLQFTQNSESVPSDFSSGQWANPYAEGPTSCLNTANCDNAHSNLTVPLTDTIVSHQDGASTDSRGSSRQYGMNTRVSTPGTLAMKWDGATGLSGAHTDILKLCGTACGSSTDTLDAVICHKMTTWTDTTIAYAAINPDSNWTGGNCEGKVAMFSIGGVLRSSLTYTTATSTTQHIVAGLTAGTYTVNDAGSYVVTDGDNSLYFEGSFGAGTFVIANGSAPPPPPTGSTGISGISVSGVSIK